MDAELLARIQFGVTAGFHFLYPPMSIGLGLLLVLLEGSFLVTKNPVYEQAARFWTKVFALTFAVGVTTGIVMEFEFGTNWATYSRYVGDIFGSPLAAEALFAFFMESIFLGILIFGWDRVGPKMHFISTIFVALGATLSAFWIIVANSWMHTPGVEGEVFRIVGEGASQRAEIIDFWKMVFNPSTMERLMHVLSASWLTGSFFAMSIAAYWLVKDKHLDVAKRTLRIALIVAALASLYQLYTGHASAIGVAYNQPAKLAAFEGHYETGPGDLYLFGWVDEEAREVKFGMKLPGMLSWLVYTDSDKALVGLNDIDDVVSKDGTVLKGYPPVNAVFQTYHIMVAVGMLLIGLSFFGLLLMILKKLWTAKWFLIILIPSFLLPHVANMTGWVSAEIGRQPWAVQDILLTKDAISDPSVVTAGHVWFSMILFTGIYLILLALFVWLVLKKVKKGPEELRPKEA